MFKKLQSSWLFQSKVNMAIATLFGCGSTLVYWNVQKKNKMNHPLVYEALCLMENNRQITELVGFPLTVDATYSSKISVSEDLASFQGTMRGPRGRMDVEISGQSMPLSEIEKKKDKALYKEFYIPAVEYDEKLMKLGVKPELRETPVDPSSRFWKVDLIQVKVDQNNSILVSPYKPTESKELEGEFSRKTLRDLEEEKENRKELYRNLELITENERLELRKVRMNEMYRKTGQPRFYLGFFMIFFAMSCYITFIQGKRHSLMKSQIFEEAMNLLRMSSEAQQLLGQDFRVLMTTRGATIRNQANFEFDATGRNGYGTVKINGTFDPREKVWTVEKAVFEQISNGVALQKVDLK